jgi:hypothetical protein
MSDIDVISMQLGTLSAQIHAVDTRLTDHVTAEDADRTEIMVQLKFINDTLSQANGARKIFVWLLATLFAAVALAKGWVIKL